MPDRKLMPVDEFRRRVLRGFSPEVLNSQLRAEIRGGGADEAVRRIVAALGAPERIEPEMIVDAAEFGHVGAIEALAAVVPAPAAQDHFDRALIAAAAYDWAPAGNYLRIARLLLAHGANPEAYDATCRQVAASTAKKDEVHALLADDIEARERARDAAVAAAFRRRQKGLKPE